MEFRFAQKGDGPLIMEFIRGLAEYENCQQAVSANEDLINEWVLEKQKAEVLFVLEDGSAVGELGGAAPGRSCGQAAQADASGSLNAEPEPREVGMAFFFTCLPAYHGRPGLYLDTLFVKPEHRGKGYGKGLLSKLAELAV